MNLIQNILFVYISSKFIRIKDEVNFSDLNFRRLDFSNYKQIKSFIFKKDFYKINNKNVTTFEFLNYSKNLGGKIGIGLSRKNIINWYFYIWIILNDLFNNKKNIFTKYKTSNLFYKLIHN